MPSATRDPLRRLAAWQNAKTERQNEAPKPRLTAFSDGCCVRASKRYCRSRGASQSGRQRARTGKIKDKNSLHNKDLQLSP